MHRIAAAAVVAVLAVGVLSSPADAAKGSRGKPKPSPTATATATPSPTATATATPSPTATTSPTPSPTPTPSASPSPSPSQTATATPSPTPTPTPSATEDVPVAPSAGYREALRLVEGALVEIADDVPQWSAAQVAAVLRANAYQLALLGPTLKVRVQTRYGSMATTAAGTGLSGGYEFFAATMWLDARAGSVFSSYPHKTVAHEYGHAWSYYHLYLTHQGSWAAYHEARGLTGDARLESSYLWQTSELIADDYRILLGSPEAAAASAFLQYQLPDPRDVPGLRDFLMSGWTSPA